MRAQTLLRLSTCDHAAGGRAGGGGGEESLCPCSLLVPPLITWSSPGLAKPVMLRAGAHVILLVLMLTIFYGYGCVVCVCVFACRHLAASDAVAVVDVEWSWMDVLLPWLLLLCCSCV